MSSNEDKTQAAYQAKRTEREAAERKHADAVASVEQARSQHADMKERNEAGDSSVTGLDLIKAAGEIPRREGLAAAAARDVNGARAAEAPLLAEHLSNVMAERVSAATAQQE